MVLSLRFQNIVLNVLECFSGIIDDKPLRFRGEVYHPYHFNCTACGVELNSDAREVKSRPGFTANDMVPTLTYLPLVSNIDLDPFVRMPTLGLRNLDRS